MWVGHEVRKFRLPFFARNQILFFNHVESRFLPPVDNIPNLTSHFVLNVDLSASKEASTLSIDVDNPSGESFYQFRATKIPCPARSLLQLFGIIFASGLSTRKTCPNANWPIWSMAPPCVYLGSIDYINLC